jgi:hypothetical protein
VDFDFFTRHDFDADQLLEDLRSEAGDVPVRRRARSTLYVLTEGVTTSFFRYRYPLLDPPDQTPWGFGLAGAKDIAAMKLEAIGGRGSRKDFIDLYFLCRTFSLDMVFQFFAEKYRGEAYDPYHRLRSLAYFADAEREPMPEMLAAVQWPEVRSFFEDQVHLLWDKGALP